MSESKKNALLFHTPLEFRAWLETNVEQEQGVWLLFGKSPANATIKASEALEEALCFGWIDGVMKKIDEQSYIKYFCPRRKNSRWSEKNKKLVTKLIKQQRMTNFGQLKIDEAKENGQWDKVEKLEVTGEQIEFVGKLMKSNTQAYENFQNMSLSVRQTYTKAYLAAKTEKGRASRIAWMIERLEKNLKPM